MIVCPYTINSSILLYKMMIGNTVVLIAIMAMSVDTERLRVCSGFHWGSRDKLKLRYLKLFTNVLGGSCWGGISVNTLLCCPPDLNQFHSLYNHTQVHGRQLEGHWAEEKKRKLELEPGSGNLRNNWQALASLVWVAVRDPRGGANQEALKDGPGPSWSWNWDTSKRLDCLASLARDPRVAVRGVRD